MYIHLMIFSRGQQWFTIGENENIFLFPWWEKPNGHAANLHQSPPAFEGLSYWKVSSNSSMDFPINTSMFP